MFGLQYIPSFDTPFDPQAATDDAYFAISGSVYEQRVGRKIEPYFKVTVENPGVAGFMPSTNRYAILWEQRDTDAEPVVVARGRLVPLPTGMSGKTIDLTFRCLPPSADDIITSAADALRVGEAVDYDPEDPNEGAELYDPLFYSADSSDDPESALSARPELWRWDRATLSLSRTHLVESDVLHTLDFEGLEEPPVLTVTNPPKPITRIRVIAGWTQVARGRQTISEPDSVQTYTFDDFLASFPQPGTSIGSDTGWTLAEAEVEAVNDDTPTTFNISGTKFGNASGGQIKLQPKTIVFRLTAAYDYSQQREELLDIVLPSGLQEIPEEDDQVETVEIVTLAALNIDGSTSEWLYEDPETLEVMHYVVGDEVLAAGKAWTCVTEHDATENFRVREYDDGPVLWERREKRAPMRDPRSSKFFDTPRGIRAVRHAIRRLYRAVLERSQCATTEFDVPWDIARGITCEHSCRILHRRLPGGELVGKVTAIELIIAADGSRRAHITLASVPGTGAVDPTPGPGQQQAGDIVYNTSYRAPSTPVDAFDLATMPPRIYALENTWAQQHAAALASPDPVGKIGTMPTRLRIAFAPLREEDLLTRRMSVSCLAPALPKQINLRPDLGG
jgi:hypothetical protein